MPFKRYRKKNLKKRRTYRRKTRLKRNVKAPRSHVFQRSVLLTQILSQAAIETFGAFRFKMDDLNAYTEFTALFDEYMLLKVQLTFLPLKVEYNNSSSLSISTFTYVTDRDDSNTPASINELMQYANVRNRSGSKQFRVTIYPRFSTMIYNGATSAYTSKRGFIDAAYPEVPHYGFKYALGASVSAQAFGYNVWAKYTLLCRAVR